MRDTRLPSLCDWLLSTLLAIERGLLRGGMKVQPMSEELLKVLAGAPL